MSAPVKAAARSPIGSAQPPSIARASAGRRAGCRAVSDRRGRMGAPERNGYAPRTASAIRALAGVPARRKRERDSGARLRARREAAGTVFGRCGGRDRAALAATWRRRARRLVRRRLRHRLATQHSTDLLAGQGLVLEQGIGEIVQPLEVLGDDRLGGIEARLRPAGGSRRRSAGRSLRRRSWSGSPSGRGTPPAGSRRRTSARACRSCPTG